MEISWNLCEFVLLFASSRLPSPLVSRRQAAIKKLNFNDYIDS